jgi:hypothetical protein
MMTVRVRVRHYTSHWHRSRFHSIAYWLLGIWMLELCWWMLVGTVIVSVWFYTGMAYAAVWAVRKLASRRH